MLLETFIFIGTIVTAIILILKTWNVVNKGEIFDPKMALLLFGVAVTAWGLSFVAFLSSISDQSTATVLGGTNTLTITQNTNAYSYFYPFQDLQQLMIAGILILTIAELFFQFRNETIGRKEGRNRD